MTDFIIFQKQITNKIIKQLDKDETFNIQNYKKSNNKY